MGYIRSLPNPKTEDISDAITILIRNIDFWNAVKNPEASAFRYANSNFGKYAYGAQWHDTRTRYRHVHFHGIGDHPISFWKIGSPNESYNSPGKQLMQVKLSQLEEQGLVTYDDQEIGAIIFVDTRFQVNGP